MRTLALGLRRWRIQVYLAIGFALLSGFVIRDWSAQPASRYLFTVAIVEDHSLELDPYEGVLGIDRAEFEGHTYSDKPPYQPLLAVPFLQAYRWTGGDTFPPGTDRDHVGRGTFYGLWWATLWSSVVPGIALALAIRWVVAQTHPEVATAVAITMVLATTIFPFTSWLFGHVLGAVLVTVAWGWLRRDAPTTRTVLFAGVVLGLVVGTEYAAAVIAAVFLVRVALTRRWGHVMALSVGTVIGTIPLFVVNYLLFGDPFEVAYQGHLGSFEGEGALGVYNLEVPRLDELTKTLFGDLGLFTLTPIVTCAVFACVLCIVRRSPVRQDAATALACLALMVVVSTGIDGYGGDSPGPRYLIPALPLLAVPLADLWRRHPRPLALAGVFGAFWMLLATLTEPGVDSSHPEPLRTWIDGFRAGDLGGNVLTGSSHPWVLLVTTAGGLVALGMAVVTDRASKDPVAPLSGSQPARR